MNAPREIDKLKETLKRSEYIQDELDLRVFHLKTLYDVGKDIFASVDFDDILKRFLLMTMGNFGIIHGFILTVDIPSETVPHFECMGFQKEDHHIQHEC